MRQSCLLLISAAALLVVTVGGGTGVEAAEAAKSAYTPRLGSNSSDLEQVCVTINSQSGDSIYRAEGISSSVQTWHIAEM